MGYVRDTFGRLSWRRQIGVALVVTLAVAVALAVLVVTLGMALILVPIVAIATLIARWRLAKAFRDVAVRRDGRQADARAIEVEYRVIGRN